MTRKQYLGFAMIAAFVIGLVLFASIATHVGLLKTFGVFVVIAAMAALITFGIKFAVEGK
jgi:hypothetical protein